MPSPKRVKTINSVQKKLANLAEHERLLPMPHSKYKISLEEWVEFYMRTELHYQKYKDYEKRFGKPSFTTSEQIWRILEPSMSGYEESFDGLSRAHFGWLNGDEKSKLNQISKQAFLVILDTFVSAGWAHRNITYNGVFDALCKKYSDYYQQGLAKTVRDMTLDTAKKCRRDLLLTGVDVNKFWDLVVGEWSKKGANPLFSIKGAKGEPIQVVLKDTSLLKEFENIVKDDPEYTRPYSSGITVLFANSKLPPKPRNREICGDVAYNEVKIGEESKKLLHLQENSRLFFDITVFKKDYVKESRLAEKLTKRLQDEYGINPSLSNTRISFSNTRGRNSKGKKNEIWSVREKHVFYRSIEEGVSRQHIKLPNTKYARLRLKHNRQKWGKHLSRYLEWVEENQTHGEHHKQVSVEMVYKAAKVMSGWRKAVRSLLDEYDLIQSHLNEYRHLYEQVRNNDGQKPIRCSFTRLINRRYQPLHFWSTYVTSKNNSPLDDRLESYIHSEDEFNSYRKRWFKSINSKTGKICELVGYDISSSQTQIIAILLGIEQLKKVAMGESGRSFKEIMADWAWQKHQENQGREGDFMLNHDLKAVKDYSGPNDSRLQELCKALWMRVSYGSSAWSVAIAQHSDPETYGPGWTPKNANRFLKYLYLKFPEVEIFLSACRQIAQIAYKRNRYTGVIFSDPFDRAKVRWNPVARGNKPLTNLGHKLIISVPGSFIKVNKGWDFEEARANKKGEYPVDYTTLRKMIAPCLVHMLDAYYSSLVMKKLADSGVTNFVGIHDCWLVPEVLIVNGEMCVGHEVLYKVMVEAAGEWYVGVGPIYKDLLRYLKRDKKFGNFIRNAQQKWEYRVNNGYKPLFLAKKS